MDLKERVKTFITQLLTEYDLKQQELADELGVSLGRFAAYAKGKEMPRIEVLMKLAEIGGLSMDDLLKTDKAPERKVISISVKGKQVGAVAGGDMKNVTIHQGDVYHNSTVKKVYKYSYEPGDLTEKQAAKIKQLVDEIVDLERITKRNAKTHAAVYSSLKKRFKVAYYRKIGEKNFDKVIAYLQGWKGRLKMTKSFVHKAPDEYRKKRYADIFTIAKKELGWTKGDVDNYIYEIYQVTSIRDLDVKLLENLYQRMNAMKQTMKK